VGGREAGNQVASCCNFNACVLYAHTAGTSDELYRLSGTGSAEKERGSQLLLLQAPIVRRLTGCGTVLLLFVFPAMN
jgi:hypothetical protein